MGNQPIGIMTGGMQGVNTTPKSELEINMRSRPFFPFLPGGDPELMCKAVLIGTYLHRYVVNRRKLGALQPPQCRILHTGKYSLGR